VRVRRLLAKRAVFQERGGGTGRRCPCKSDSDCSPKRPNPSTQLTGKLVNHKALVSTASRRYAFASAGAMPALSNGAKRSPYQIFDIFKVESPGDLRWRTATSTMETAIARATGLANSDGYDYVIVHHQTGERRLIKPACRT